MTTTSDPMRVLGADGGFRVSGHARRVPKVLRCLVQVLTGLVAVAGVTAWPAVAQASFPGANGKIVYTNSAQGGTPLIFAMNADGGAQAQIATIGGSEPAWSPDGSRVAFEGFFNGVGGIFTMNADGSGVTRVTAGSQPAWSPDGTKLTFSDADAIGGQIWSVNVNGTGRTKLTTLPHNLFPAWSPDGTTIAFCSTRNGGGEVWLMNANGTGQRALVTLDRNGDGLLGGCQPNWSPDGTKIAYTNGRHLFITSTATVNAGTPITGSASHASWSPDGTQLVFQNFDGIFGNQIYRVNANGTGLTQLTFGGGFQGNTQADWGVGRNHIPMAGNDTYVTAEDTPLTVAAPGLLANDTDADGDAVTATLVTEPAHGALTLNANGSFTYTPAANSNGPDSFTYKANDARADSNDATVAITVTEANDAPTAAADAATVAEDASVAIDVAANDMPGPANEAGQALAVGAVAQPLHGQAEIVPLGADAGEVGYTPAADYHGPDSFTYTVCDDGKTNGLADAKCDTASVSVTVTAVNDPPTASADAATVAEDASVAIDVMANDASGPANEAGQGLSVGSLTQPAHGQAAIIAIGADAGKVNYTPAADYHGPDSFTYTVCDDGMTDGVADPRCDTASVTITVTAINHVPVARNDSYQGEENTPLTVAAAAGMLANDTDADGDRIFLAVIATQPTHGVLSVDRNGSFRYTPSPGFFGQDSFTYKVSDDPLASPTTPPAALSNAATVTITIVPRLLFTSTRDGNSDIYAMRSDGSGVTRLTTDAAIDANPVWSPGHRKIAFTSTRAGNPEIYVMNPDGTAQTRLTVNNLVIDATPAWSPDGTRIAFSSNRRGNMDIYVMNADGTAQTSLTVNRAIDTTPAWSPDGRTIAFASTRDGNSEIYAMAATGECSGCTTRRLTTNAAVDTTPTWSRTGIAFSSSRDGNPEIYAMNADGTAQTRLTVNPATDSTPTWSPDGQSIAFASTREDPASEIYAMQADGTGVTRLTTSPGIDALPGW